MSRLAIAAVCCLFSAVAGPLAPAWGQAFFQMGQQSVAGRLIEPPRAVLQQLREAERAASQRRYSEAVVILGELLQRQPAADDDDELSGQDFFIVNPEHSALRPAVAVRQTLFGEARRMLSSMPAAALQTYELRYGPEARELLNRSAPRHDWTSVAEVRRRFFHTEAGRDATALLAQRAVSHGRPLQAIRLLEALQSHPKLSAASREGVTLMLAASRQSGLSPSVSTTASPGPDDSAPEDSGAEENSAARQQPASAISGEVMVDGKAETPPGGEAFQSWLEARFGEARRRVMTPSGNVTMLGDDPSRAESSQGQMPLSIPR